MRSNSNPHLQHAQVESPIDLKKTNKKKLSLRSLQQEEETKKMDNKMY
jgi:hypothetical protein